MPPGQDDGDQARAEGERLRVDGGSGRRPSASERSPADVASASGSTSSDASACSTAPPPDRRGHRGTGRRGIGGQFVPDAVGALLALHERGILVTTTRPLAI